MSMFTSIKCVLLSNIRFIDLLDLELIYQSLIFVAPMGNIHNFFPLLFSRHSSWIDGKMRLRAAPMSDT